MKFWSKLRRGLFTAEGIGIVGIGAGILTGNSVLTVKGAQLATAGAVKTVSTRAGRGIHRILSPAAAVGIGFVAQAAGFDNPVVQALVSADSIGLALAVETGVATTLDALMVSGAQRATKGSKEAVLDFKRDSSW